MVVKRFPGKVSQLIAIDEKNWEEVKILREPYGTVNEMFEDFIKIILGKEPDHPELLKRLREVVPTLSSDKIN